MMEWISAYCKEDGKTYAIKGKEMAAMLAAMGNKLPKGRVMHRRFECDTLEDVAELTRQFSEEWIGRFPEGEN